MHQLTRSLIPGLVLLTLIASASVMPVSAQAPETETPEADTPPVFKPIQPGPVVVVLTSGEHLRGELVEDRPGSVKLKVAQIEVRIPRDRIESIYPENDLMERYKLLRESIPQDDADQILFLAEWLRRNGMLDEALAETNSALRADPTHIEAIRQRQLIEQQIRLRDLADARRESGGVPAEKKEGRRRSKREAFPMISEKDANLIKVFEVDLNNPPRMLIEPDVIDSLLDRFGGRLGVPATQEGRATFHRKPPGEILEAMFRLRARDLYGEVQVMDLPGSLKSFRDGVNSTWLVNSCATVRCHGSVGAGRLMLANRRPSADRSFLTNFLILENHKLDDGTPMINYEAPSSSPLLQMTLPRHESFFPHPKVKGWRPIFTSTNARRFQQAVRWIDSMYLPRPEYPIDYTPPRGDGGGIPGVGDGSGDRSADPVEPNNGPIER